MKVIIIEDEKPSARRLGRMLSNLNIEAQAMLHSVKESVEWFRTNEHPDLILLDIQLSDGLSFEIFEEVTVNSAIIFTTAYDEYALKAFKLNSIDYLLKPIDDDELEIAIDKFKSNQPEKHDLMVDINQIKKLLVNPLEREYKRRFTIKVGQHLRVVDTDDIECFYSDHKATYCHTNQGKNYLMDFSLEQLDDKLDPLKFYRVNRKFLIQMNAITDIISYTNSRLQIKLNHYKEQEIIVSRERVKEFKNWLE
ncbi:LytR/AlgR family response regulator transcription factor [Lutimonas zeaxanthinifaciens]|uniref:LytR/AlgR family response regulator transcription factor n=1 Tax=Lutimonas zeaxanthinifaciens TaxID=3060215 RepID=UPI00265C9B96|nr:LytTR family DNA-binding domain-containing protein [Lutimonas sp. YSD2104]WKK67590.1 LytTR family DNA-binding domain-containing protein [Lutimonas sp. YSD2104]